MKICFLGLEVVPVKGNIFIGGTANNIVRLAKGLAKRGHNVHIVTTDTANYISSEFPIELPWAKIHSIKIQSRYASIFYGLEVMWKLMRKAIEVHSQENFDIFNIHSGHFASSILASILSAMTCVPAVFTLYSLSDRDMFFLYDSSIRLLSFIEKGIFLFRSAKIIAVSENVRKGLLKKGVPENKICYIPPVVDINIFNPKISKSRARKKLGLNPKTDIILYLGNWNPWKGASVLIRAMRNLVDKFSNIKLILAWGEIINWHYAHKARISKYISKLGLEPYIIELGVVNDIANLISASDIVVVPFLSTYGVADIPLTIIEAMACGKPVIATETGGIPEIIESGINGFLVPPGDPKSIADKILFLLKNKKIAREIGLRASQTASIYSIDNVVPKLENLYERLLNE